MAATLDWLPQTPGAVIAHHARVPGFARRGRLVRALFFFAARKPWRRASLPARPMRHLAHYDD